MTCSDENLYKMLLSLAHNLRHAHNRANTAAAEQAETEKEDEAVQEAYITQSGKVSSVSEEDEKGLRVVTIDNEQGGLRFVLDSMTPVLNRENSSLIQAGDLKEGMEIAVVYEANSPMGLSMPPYLGKVTAVVANTDKGFFVVGHFDEELTDMKKRFLYRFIFLFRFSLLCRRCVRKGQPLGDFLCKCCCCSYHCKRHTQCHCFCQILFHY